MCLIHRMLKGMALALLGLQLLGPHAAQARDVSPDSIEAEVTGIEPVKRNTSFYSITVVIDPDLGPYRDVQMVLRGAAVATQRMNAEGTHEFRVKGSQNVAWAVKVRSLRGKTLAFRSMGKLPAELDGP